MKEQSTKNKLILLAMMTTLLLVMILCAPFSALYVSGCIIGSAVLITLFVSLEKRWTAFRLRRLEHIPPFLLYVLEVALGMFLWRLFLKFLHACFSETELANFEIVLVLQAFVAFSLGMGIAFLLLRRFTSLLSENQNSVQN